MYHCLELAFQCHLNKNLYFAMKGAKFRDRCALNILKTMNLTERKILGCKSHDAHFLLQYLSQAAVRKTLTKQLELSLLRLGAYLRGLCDKVI